MLNLLADRQTEFFGDPAQSFLLGLGQTRKAGFNISGDLREQLLDQLTASFCQMDQNHTSVIFISDPFDQLPFLQVIQNEGHVPSGTKQLGTKLTLTHTPQVVERFQHSELRLGKPLEIGAEKEVMFKGVIGSGKLDKGIERRSCSLRIAIVVSGHFSPKLV